MPAIDTNTIISIALPVLLIAFLIFAIILPQRRRDKKVKQMLSDIKPGVKVRTIGGLYGKVVKADENTITLEVGPDKIRMPFVRSAVAMVDQNEDTEAAQKQIDPAE